LQNPDLLGRLSHGARQRAVEKFDLARQTEKLERIYDRVSGKPVPAGSPGLHLVAR
jgi:hypothetical protein